MIKPISPNVVATGRARPSVGAAPAREAPVQNISPPAAAVGETKAGAQADSKLMASLEQVANHVRSLQRTLEFSVDEASGRTVITVFDAETEEVIRQIPSEELLVIANRLNSNGSLVTERT